MAWFRLNSGLLRHVANSAAAGETLVWRRLMGQPTEDLWAAGIEGWGSSWPQGSEPLRYDVSRTLEVYEINSVAKLREARRNLFFGCRRARRRSVRRRKSNA